MIAPILSIVCTIVLYAVFDIQSYLDKKLIDKNGLKLSLNRWLKY